MGGFPGLRLESDPPVLVPASAGVGPADCICAVGQTGPPCRTSQGAELDVLIPSSRDGWSVSLPPLGQGVKDGGGEGQACPSYQWASHHVEIKSKGKAHCAHAPPWTPS